MVEVPRPVRKVFRLEEMSNEQVSRMANELKNKSLFVKEESEVAPLVKDLFKVWLHTVNEKSLHEPQSSGRKGLEDAHQWAVDGFITLLRRQLKSRNPGEIDRARNKLLDVLKHTTQTSDYQRFEGYLKRLS